MKRHPYIIATVIATLLAVVVWLCVPKEYSAVTKVSDEYKEVDLAIGMNSIMAHIKETLGSSDAGMNDIEVYSKVLQTEDFARSIAHKQVPGKQMTYGEYLGKKDTIEAVRKRINCNLSVKQGTLTISFTDRDPLVASQMLDSVTAQLQQVVTESRHRMAEAQLRNAQEEMRQAKADLEKAQTAYNDYMDSHGQLVTMEMQQREKALADESKVASQHYEKTIEQCVRQEALLKRSYLSFAVVSQNTVPLETNDHLVGYVLSFVIIALILTAGARFYRKRGKVNFEQLEWGDFFSPWCLTIVIWLGDIVLYFLQGTLDPIGPEFLTCFTLWLATFIPCSLLAFWLTKDDGIKVLPDHRKPIDANLWGFYGLTALSLMMTLLYAKAIYGIVSQFDMDNILYNIRVLAVANTENFGLLNYTQGINLGLFLVAIWLYPRISKWMVVLIVIVNLILELAMMEKSGILIMILGTLFVLYERRVIRVRTIGLTFVFIVILFFFFNMSKEDADSEESMTFMDFFGMYVTSPMVAFERLRVTISDTFAANTLNDFYPQLQRFGIHIESIGRLQDFVFVPIPTNVYTIMQPFYNDFGRVGVAFFGFLYGSIFGYVYRRFYEGDDMYKCFYTYLVEVIIIQFYNENLLQVFHLVLEASLVIILLTRLNKFSLSPTTIQTARYEDVQS